MDQVAWVIQSKCLTRNCIYVNPAFGSLIQVKSSAVEQLGHRCNGDAKTRCGDDRSHWQVTAGNPQVGDVAIARVDLTRRAEIMRNHTATHLLHAALHSVLGSHARQAGSLVAPTHLRFDFTHPEPMTHQEILAVEAHVNQAILTNYPLNIAQKPLDQAIQEGAMAIFGEKYEGIVRTIQIGDDALLSYELCGGTHVDNTGDVGLFLITYEGSIAAGVRRIERHRMALISSPVNA